MFSLSPFYLQGNSKKPFLFCEICGIFYDEINRHLNNPIHIKKVKKLDFSEIDDIIKEGLDLETFLKKNGVKMVAKVDSNENEKNKNITDTSDDADVLFVGAWIELE